MALLGTPEPPLRRPGGALPHRRCLHSTACEAIHRSAEKDRFSEQVQLLSHQVLNDTWLRPGGHTGRRHRRGFWELVAAGGAPEDIDGVPSPRHEMASYLSAGGPSPLPAAAAAAAAAAGSHEPCGRQGAGRGGAGVPSALSRRGRAARSNMRRLARQARAAREVQELPRSFRDLRKSRPVSRSLGTS